MRHLTDTEFVDLIETPAGCRPIDAAHVAACAALPRAGGRARRGAARRRRATTCPSRRRSSGITSARACARRSRRIAGPGAAGVGAGLPKPPGRVGRGGRDGGADLMTVVWRATLHAPAPAGRGAAELADARPLAVDRVQVASAGDNIEADEAWAVRARCGGGPRVGGRARGGISAIPGRPRGSRSS